MLTIRQDFEYWQSNSYKDFVDSIETVISEFKNAGIKPDLRVSKRNIAYRPTKLLSEEKISLPMSAGPLTGIEESIVTGYELITTSEIKLNVDISQHDHLFASGYKSLDLRDRHLVTLEGSMEQQMAVLSADSDLASKVREFESARRILNDVYGTNVLICSKK